ncbi:hypothetical protein C8F04DRAFT_1394567 [Mycena alexandri]|uniref:Uncharacterized protein n=1 Tax=Mycena alexandri TaxID=1745969 RepID=A0AAD6X1T5_9AGAR|nr:hypothetical protein C8F04DRAFT_1394567 [Mycena alexandri]
MGASLPPRAPISEIPIDREAMIISAFTLEGYHVSCQWYCSQSYEETIRDTAVVSHFGSTQFSAPTEPVTGSLPKLHGYQMTIQPTRVSDGSHAQKIMRNGWTRVHSSELDPSNPVIVHHVYPNAPRTSRLAQANSILNRLRMTSDFSDYVLIDGITYLVEISGPLMDLPAGYLFLCPLTHLQSGTPMGFQFPECVAYWSS